MNYEEIFKEIVNSVNVRHSYKWDNPKKQIAIREFRRFFTLKIKYNDHQHTLLSPGPVIDNIWHEFLLRPQQYYDYCMLVSGKIINHFPKTDENVIERYKNTIKYYKETFNEQPPDFMWPYAKDYTKDYAKKNNISKMVIYVIDEITNPEKRKTFKITAPFDITYRELKDYVVKISNLGHTRFHQGNHERIGLITSDGDCLESHSLRFPDKKMRDVSYKNVYKINYVHANLGC